MVYAKNPRRKGGIYSRKKVATGAVSNNQPPPKPQPQYTPLYTRYLTEKVKHRNAILFYRIGDFYEVFNEDAKTVAKELDLTLVGRDVGTGRIPMCGIPCYSSERYTSKLTQKGYKVAYADNSIKS